jgi:hypothetical protein
VELEGILFLLSKSCFMYETYDQGQNSCHHCYFELSNYTWSTTSAVRLSTLDFSALVPFRVRIWQSGWIMLNKACIGISPVELFIELVLSSEELVDGTRFDFGTGNEGNYY